MLYLHRTGMRIDGAPLSVAQPPPELGQDTESLLTDLGLSTDDIYRLKREGAI